MKRSVNLLIGLIILMSLMGCFTTYRIRNESFTPGRDAYKHFLVKNNSPYFIKIAPGPDNYLLDPGTEIVLKRGKPVLGSRFGRFSFMAYAYREYRNGRLSEFIGQQEVWAYLDGSVFDGRVFADNIELGESGWYLPSLGHPTKYQGTFIVPWEFNIKTK